MFEWHSESVPTLTETVSFSFTIGTTPMESNSLIVFTAFRYLARWERGVVRPFFSSERTHVRDSIPAGKKNLRNGLTQLTEQIVPQGS
jgi:hypothetical protein